jgi:hypothetical protein
MNWTKTFVGAALSAGFLIGSAVGASAAIACTGNVCWHTHDRFGYPADAGVVIHRDDWRWGPNDHYVFREHEGHGYWRGDNWISW